MRYSTIVAWAMMAGCCFLGCSDSTESDADSSVDIGGDLQAGVDQGSSNLPDGYGPLYDCNEPGKACNAHDPCAISPICGKDKKCRPTSLMDCSDDLDCTEDKCVGQGMCSNLPRAGTCMLGIPAGSSSGGAGADGGSKGDAAADAGKPADSGGNTDQGAPTKTVFKCFKAGDRHPSDPCLMCNPVTSDGGITTNNKKWSAANSGKCDDGKSCTKDDYCQSGICKGSYFGDLCADGYSCTDDICDGKGGCLSNKLKADWCLINGTCYKKGAAHPSGGCFTCVPSTSQSNWTAITNTCMINGKCYNKGAKNPGGCGECDPAMSTSKWTVKGTTCCLIGGKSYNAGVKHTSGCGVCDPTKSTTAWTQVPNVCEVGSKCYVKGAKHTGGCAECDPAVNAKGWTVKGTTYCLIQDTCYSAGTKDSTGCSSCVPTKDKYKWTPGTGLCLISGKCYTSGTKHPQGCAECKPGTTATAWTLLATTTDCLIDGVCYKANTVAGCGKCDPATSQTSWTKIPGCNYKLLDIGKYGSTYSYTSHTRGYWFEAPLAFSIVGLRVPNDVGSYPQNVEVLRLNTKPDTSKYTSLFYKKGVAGNNFINLKVSFKKGDVVAVLGARGTTTMYNSYSTTNTYKTKLGGQSITLKRLMLQSNLYSGKATGTVMSNSASYGRIEMRYTVP